MFTKKEFTFISSVLIILTALTLVNLQSSYRKSRDSVRKNALGDTVNKIYKFKEAIGYFPLSKEDRIVGCDGYTDIKGRWVFKECAWGGNSENSIYFNPISTDPYADKGRNFAYFSTGEHFQLYGALEGTYEDEYDKNIVGRNISCGDTVCNTGRTDSKYIEVLYSPLP